MNNQLIRILNELDEDALPTGAVNVIVCGHDFWITNAPIWLIKVAR